MPARAALDTAKLIDPHLRDPAFGEEANESVLLWITVRTGHTQTGKEPHVCQSMSLEPTTAKSQPINFYWNSQTLQKG